MVEAKNVPKMDYLASTSPYVEISAHKRGTKKVNKFPSDKGFLLQMYVGGGYRRRRIRTRNAFLPMLCLPCVLMRCKSATISGLTKQSALTFTS